MKHLILAAALWVAASGALAQAPAAVPPRVEGPTVEGKPFELVLVATDRRMKDVDDYEAVISRMVPLRQRFVQLWAGAAGYQDNLGARGVLPASLLIDKNGKVVERWQGRIPPDAWDKIAELL